MIRILLFLAFPLFASGQKPSDFIYHYNGSNGYIIHHAKPNQSYVEIARMYGLPVHDIIANNSGTVLTKTKNGDEVRIPLNAKNWITNHRVTKNQGLEPVLFKVEKDLSKKALLQIVKIPEENLVTWNGVAVETYYGGETVIIGWLQYQDPEEVVHTNQARIAKQPTIEKNETSPSKTKNNTNSFNYKWSRFTANTKDWVNNLLNGNSRGIKIDTVPNKAASVKHPGVTKPSISPPIQDQKTGIPNTTNRQPEENKVSLSQKLEQWKFDLGNKLKRNPTLKSNSASPNSEVKKNGFADYTKDKSVAKPELKESGEHIKSKTNNGPVKISRDTKSNSGSQINSEKENEPLISTQPPLSEDGTKVENNMAKEEKMLSESVETKPINNLIVEPKLSATNSNIVKSEKNNLPVFTASKNGTASLFYAGPKSGRYYVVTNLTKRGQIVKVTNITNSRSILAEVLAPLPQRDLHKGYILKLSDNAKSQLGISSSSFSAKIDY